MCFTEKAEVYCVNDELELCVSCDQEAHGSSNLLTMHHKRVSVKSRPMKYSQCQTHFESMELVCKDCVKQICISCKLNGDHSEEPFKSHTVISMKDCYDFLKRTKKKRTDQMKNLTKMIKKHVSKLESRIKKMRRDFGRLETQIYNIYQKAMIKLIQIKKDSLNELESACTLMNNRLDELKWMEYFTKFQIDYINPEDFIHLNFTHQRMQNLLYRNMTLPNFQIYDKHSDYKVSGEIELLDFKQKVDSDIRRRKDQEIKQKARRKLMDQEKLQKMEEEEFYRELEATKLEKQGLTSNAASLKRNSLLTNRRKRNSIHINTQRFNLLSNIPKLNIPNSESTRLPTSTARQTIQSEGRPSETFSQTDRLSIPTESRTMRSNSEIVRMNSVKPKLIDSEGEEEEPKKAVDVILEEAESEEGLSSRNLPSTSRMRKSLSDKSKETVEGLVKRFGEEQIKTSLQEAFDDSEILEAKEASYIYLNCIDPEMEIMPTTECLELYSINDLPSPIDVLNILSDHPQSTLFLFKFRGQKFGAFSATNWFNEGESGNERNFLFNINKDHMISVNKNKKRKIFQWRDDHGMGWGATDLVFHEDGSWSSKIGSTYTTNTELTEEETKTYLCGEYRFMPEILEIWKFDYTF